MQFIIILLILFLLFFVLICSVSLWLLFTKRIYLLYLRKICWLLCCPPNQ